MDTKSYHTDNNWCYNCTKQSSNGFIRNTKFYCSDYCYDNSQKRAHHHHHQAHHHQHHQKHHHHQDHHQHHRQDHHHQHHHHHGSNSNFGGAMSTYRPPAPRIEKQCNYCFDKFDMMHHRGIDHGPLWFCCQQHLNLANPRPKVMMVPGPAQAFLHGPIHIAPQVMPHLMGARIIGPFAGAPFLSPF